MQGLESDTVGGFNAMIAQQKKEAGEALVSTVLFDDVSEVVHDRLSIQDVENMTEKEYFVRGSTALLDAIGDAIRHIGNVHKYARKEDVPEKTLFIITTDGLENASTRHSYDKIKKMIERQKEKYRWEFIFIGANIDAVEVAGRFGLEKNRAVRYESDGAGTRLNYRVMSKIVSVSRSAQNMTRALEEEDLLAPIREDYESREKSDKRSI